MRNVIFKVSIDNANVDEDMLFEQNSTDDMIEEAYIEWRKEQIHGGWSEDGDWTEVED